MKSSKSSKFSVPNAAVDKARAGITKRLTTLFLPHERIADRLPKPAQRCPHCGYWVQGACSPCEEASP
jgi:hypothetical protein